MSEREKLGRGWRFPVSLTLTGSVGSSAYEDSVRESIFIILGTAPGERVTRPDFGCMVHDLMFAPNSPATSALAQYYCEEALLKFEPRIANVRVVAVPHSNEPNRLDLRVMYTLRESPGTRNLVYPFYLQKGDEA